MNELQLSNDINVITVEIKGYQNMAGQSVFEIGRRLKHVRDDLKYKGWEKWCEESLNISSRQARKYVKVFEQFSNRNSGSDLGINALYLIATIPEEEREKEHETSSGKQKKPEDMTVKELQELKKKLKEAQDEAVAAKKIADFL